jgi:hypothetical protein
MQGVIGVLDHTLFDIGHERRGKFQDGLGHGERTKPGRGGRDVAKREPTQPRPQRWCGVLRVTLVAFFGAGSCFVHPFLLA